MTTRPHRLRLATETLRFLALAPAPVDASRGRAVPHQPLQRRAAVHRQQGDVSVSKPFPTIRQETIDELRELEEFDAGWRRIKHPTCGKCGTTATWRNHRTGAQRCNTCPRLT